MHHSTKVVHDLVQLQKEKNPEQIKSDLLKIISCYLMLWIKSGWHIGMSTGSGSGDLEFYSQHGRTDLQSFSALQVRIHFVVLVQICDILCVYLLLAIRKASLIPLGLVKAIITENLTCFFTYHHIFALKIVIFKTINAVMFISL